MILLKQYAQKLEQSGVCSRILFSIYYFKKSLNMFEHMEIAEYIYEDVA